jgi:hypothetical protein
MINLSDIETIAKTVKISISKESLLEFSENLQKKIDLAMEIDEIDTSHIDANTIFFNFFYQSLDLLEEPIEEEPIQEEEENDIGQDDLFQLSTFNCTFSYYLLVLFCML